VQTPPPQKADDECVHRCAGAERAGNNRIAQEAKYARQQRHAADRGKRFE
jgi:hypothetical protein